MSAASRKPAEIGLAREVLRAWAEIELGKGATPAELAAHCAERGVSVLELTAAANRAVDFVIATAPMRRGATGSTEGKTDV